jgi:hypothetical protein
MKRSEFTNNQNLRSQLHILLEHPVLKLAIEALVSEAPSIPQAIPGVDYSALVATAGARHIGFLQFARDLRALTQVSKSQETRATQESDAALRDVAKATLVEQGLYSQEELDNYEQRIQAIPQV